MKCTHYIIKLCRWLILNLYFVLISASVFSQIKINDLFENTTLENQMTIFRDSTNSMSIEEIIRRRSELPFVVSFVRIPNFSYDHVRRWTYLKIHNDSKTIQSVFLRMHHTFIDTVEYYAIKNKKIVKRESFRSYNIHNNQTNQITRLPIIEVKIAPLDSVEVLVMSRKNIGTWIHVLELFSKKAFYERERNENLTYGILSGIMLIVVFMSFVLFLIHQEPTYLFYLFYSVCVTLGILGNLGYTNYYFNSRFYFITGEFSFHFFVLLTIIFIILFTHSLFGIRKDNFRKLFSFGYILLLACLVFALILPFNNYLKNSQNRYIFDIIFSFFSFGYLLNVLLSGILLFKKKRIISTIYLLAFFPLLILLAVNNFSEIGIIRRPFSLVFLAPICVIFELVVLFIGLAYRFFESIKQKKFLETQIISNQIKTQESERSKIARDLHDDLGSTLSVLKEQIYLATDNQDTQNLINKAIDDLRSISHNLLPADFEAFGFIPSLEKHIAKLNEAGLKITFITFGERKTLQNDFELNIYRILVEILHNFKKHSETRIATIQLIYHTDYLHISVEEEKTKKNTEKGNGIGEKSISSRLEYLHARVLENGTGENGYSYIFEVPYDQNPNR